MRSTSLKRSGLALRQSLLKLVAGVAVLLLSLWFYAAKIEPGWVQVVTVQVTLPNLTAEFEDYRIVQISDIHVDSDWMTAQRLQEIVKLVNKQQPDLVALTGDFITGEPEPHLAALTKGLRDLNPKDFSAAVLGNHDHWSGKPNLVRQALSDAGVVNLKNEVQTIRRKTAVLNIAGVDDHWVKEDDLNAVLKQTIPGAAILLVHEPDYADKSSATGRFDLELSGHSHGGQVALPFVGPLQLPPYGEKYPSGKYQVGQMIHYTNRGIGMVKPRVRFNCRPEVTVMTLKAGKKS